MTMNSKYLLPGVLVLVPVFALAQAAQPAHPQAPQAAKPAVTTKTSPRPVTEGERIFQQNCARCHNPPNGFSPHISGTILRHMRVRASLSQHDEQELFRFFNP
jgi:mono/diheme cytochrome c family protein